MKDSGRVGDAGILSALGRRDRGRGGGGGKSAGLFRGEGTGLPGDVDGVGAATFCVGAAPGSGLD